MLTTTTAAYLRLLDVPEGQPRRDAWALRYEAAHADIFDVYYDGRGDVARRHQAADEVATVARELPEREIRAGDLVYATAHAMHEAGLLERPWLPTVLMVGSGTANGWVALHQGKPTLFLALELLPTPPYDAILIAHEGAHVAHALSSAVTWPAPVGAMVFIEGLAVTTSRALYPGHSDSAYLWFDDHHKQWVRDCQEAKDTIRSLAETAWETCDASVTGRLFEGAPQPASVPPRAGYWLGDRVVQAALLETTLAELFRLTRLPPRT